MNAGCGVRLPVVCRRPRSESLVVPESVSSRWEVLDPSYQRVSVVFVQRSGLEPIGEMDRLNAATRRGLGFGRGEELRAESAPSKTGLNPQALQLATVSPCPTADAGNDLAFFADEDRQIDFVPESHRRGCLSADPRFQQFEVTWIREVLHLEVHARLAQASTSCSISDKSSK